MALVLFGGVRGEIGTHLSLEARLQRIAPHHRHRAPVNLDHEAAARPVGKREAEHKIGRKSNLARHALMHNACHPMMTRRSCAYWHGIGFCDRLTSSPFGKPAVPMHDGTAAVAVGGRLLQLP
jgi:hypothetical protein